MKIKRQSFTYQGNKMSSFPDLLRLFKEKGAGRHLLIDLCGGGGAVAMSAALNGYKAFYNELNPILYKVVKCITSGAHRDLLENEPIFRQFIEFDDFKQLLQQYSSSLKNGDALTMSERDAFCLYVTLNTWSFNSWTHSYFTGKLGKRDYDERRAFHSFIFDKDSAPARRVWGDFRAFDDYLQRYPDFSFAEFAENLPRLSRLFTLTTAVHDFCPNSSQRRYERMLFDELLQVPYSSIGIKTKGEKGRVGFDGIRWNRAHTTLARFYKLEPCDVSCHQGDYEDSYNRILAEIRADGFKENQVILFLDPPYKDTTGKGYRGTGEFDYGRFCDFMRRVTQADVLLIYTSFEPLTDDSVCIWTKERRSSLYARLRDSVKRDKNNECAFILKPQLSVSEPFYLS